MSKITEVILEPSKIYVGSDFLLKIKATRYLTYDELKIKKYNQIQDFKYKELKGD